MSVSDACVKMTMCSTDTVKHCRTETAENNDRFNYLTGSSFVINQHNWQNKAMLAYDILEVFFLPLLFPFRWKKVQHTLDHTAATLGESQQFFQNGAEQHGWAIYSNVYIMIPLTFWTIHHCVYVIRETQLQNKRGALKCPQTFGHTTYLLRRNGVRF